jgi:hypothetical protein
MATTGFEGTLDWRKLFEGWRRVAEDSVNMHYDAQRRFNNRGRWLGGCATLLTTLIGATVIKEINAASTVPTVRWIIGAVGAVAGVLTALHTFLGDEGRAASHRSTAAGYAAALRRIDEELTFGHRSASEAEKAADTIRQALDALSANAPEVPGDILRKYMQRSRSNQTKVL